MENLEKIKETPESTKIKLEKLSEELFFNDGRGGIIMSAYKKHLKEMAGFIDQIESRGYDIWVESIPKDFGYTRIYIKSVKEEFDKEILVYDQDYNPSYWSSDGDFIDPYPDKKSLEQIFEKAIEKIELNSRKQVKKMAA